MVGSSNQWPRFGFYLHFYSIFKYYPFLLLLLLLHNRQIYQLNNTKVRLSLEIFEHWLMQKQVANINGEVSFHSFIYSIELIVCCHKVKGNR